MHYEYDPRNNMTKVVEPGLQVINAYDDKGYGIEQQVSTGSHHLFSYEIDRDERTLSTKVTSLHLGDPDPIVRIDYFDKDGRTTKEVWEPDTDHGTTAILAREPNTGELHVTSGSCKLASGRVSLGQPTRRQNNADEIDDLRQQCLSMAAKANTVHKPHQSVPVKMGLWDVTVRQEATAPPEMAAVMKKNCSVGSPALLVSPALPVQTISPVTARMHSCMDEAGWRRNKAAVAKAPESCVFTQRMEDAVDTPQV
jgi:hypothetical protein